MSFCGAGRVVGARVSALAVRHFCTAPQISEEIVALSRRNQTGVSLKYMLQLSDHSNVLGVEKQLLVSSQFLHHELPIRLAHRVTELANLPYGLNTKRPIVKVRQLYEESFARLRSFPPVKDAADQRRFVEMIASIHKNHAHVVPTVAHGVALLRRELLSGVPEELAHLPDIHHFLDNFYMSRIGIRMLIGQLVAVTRAYDSGTYLTNSTQRGIINTCTSPIKVAKEAIDDSRTICMQTYGSAPDIEIIGDPSLTFPYVPAHLHHMMFELLKNSLRAVQERSEALDRTIAPIRVVVADGEEDITIKISDEGGGIPRSGIGRIWTYLYTTGRFVGTDEENLETAGPVLAGYGYGLPLSRLYARYLGGDLQIMSMEGYGTDAYLHLCRVGDKKEPLP